MTNLLRYTAAATMALSLAACGSTGQSQQKDQQPQTMWVELGKSSTGYSKMGPPIAVSYKGFAPASANQERAIELKLTPSVDLESLRVSYSTLDGASLVGVDEYSTSQVLAGVELPLFVNAVASNQAGGSLAVFVETISAGFKSSRAYEILLNPNVQQKKSQKLETGDDGKKYIVHEL